MPRYGGEVMVSLSEGALEAALSEALGSGGSWLLASAGVPVPPVPLAELASGARPPLHREVELPDEEGLAAVAPTLADAHRLIALLVERGNDCAREVARKDEMLRLRAEVAFGGGSSQRSSTLGVGDGAGKGGRGADGDAGGGESGNDKAASGGARGADPGDGAGKAANDATGNADNGGDSAKKGADPGKGAGSGGAGKGGGGRGGADRADKADKADNDDADGGEQEKGRPRRGKGCMSGTTEGLPRIRVRKPLDSELLEELEEKGNVRRLPDGHYAIVVPVNAFLVVEVEFERWEWECEDKKKTYEADSAASKVIPGSDLSYQLLALVLYLRFCLSLPATRVSKLFEGGGFRLSRQRIYNACSRLAVALARPICERMLEVALKAGALQADESWVKVREELAAGRSNSVVWLVRTSEALNIPPVVVLNYTVTREASKLAEMIRGFAGTLMADCYPGYAALLREFADTLELVACLQHARSNFADAAKSVQGKKGKMGEEAWKALPVNQVIALFKKVFKAEGKAPPGCDPEERRANRQKRVRPALDELFALVEKHNAALRDEDEGKFAKAVRYAVRYKDRFYAACDDPSVPLHNSACEQVFARLGVHRSNSHQWDTSLGAASLCWWFSVVSTAEANGADARCYLQFLLEEAVPELRSHKEWHWVPAEELRGDYEDVVDGLPGYGDLSYLDDFMPWSERFAEYSAGWRKSQQDLLVFAAKGIADSLSSGDDDAGD